MQLAHSNYKFAICAASTVDEAAQLRMETWINNGKQGKIGYLERHLPLKKSLDSVLPGCRSIICFAFPYYSPINRRPDKLHFSRYALSEDYHDVIRRTLSPVARELEQKYGGKTRICIDSAPVSEKYWAVKAGLGTILRNGLLYVPGYGTWVFLAEILSTSTIPSCEPGNLGTYESVNLCGKCRMCIDSCPSNAILPDATIDCNRCRSAITIECHDKTLPPDLHLGNNIYGCDICQEVCPLNKSEHLKTSEPENRGDLSLKTDNSEPGTRNLFPPKEEILSLTKDRILNMSPEEFDKIFRGTPVHRIGLSQLRRNCQT